MISPLSSRVVGDLVDSFRPNPNGDGEPGAARHGFMDYVDDDCVSLARRATSPHALSDGSSNTLMFGEG